MLKVWLLSVVALNLCVLSTVMPFWRSEVVQKTVWETVFPTNAAYSPMPNLQANFLQLLSHPGAAIAAQAEARLLLDMRQNNHVRALPPAGGAATERPQTTRADVHHMTETVSRKGPFVFFDEPEPHGVGQSLGPCMDGSCVARGLFSFDIWSAAAMYTAS